MNLDSPLQALPGVGPARAAKLSVAGLHLVRDLLLHLPRFRGPPPPVSETGPLPLGVDLRLRARLIRIRPVFQRGRRGIGLDALLERQDGRPIRARFFNAGYLRRHLLVDECYQLEGRTDASQGDTLLHPSFTQLPQGFAEPPPLPSGCRVAYTIPAGLSERTYADLVKVCLTALPMEDPLGELSAEVWSENLRCLHQPLDADSHERARREFAARELTAFAWHVADRRRTATAAPGRAWRWDDHTHQRALARLPYPLTPGQTTALAAIRADLQDLRPMYRLLQGDVGCGKTAVALVAALAVIAEGGQVLWLAPTAVLAAQLHRFAQQCLQGSRVVPHLLTGGTDGRIRSSLLVDLASGQARLVIGTHALIEESIQVHTLGLAIIDEQHRFGVAQRAALLRRSRPDQGFQPHLLLISATPIPRTLALTAYGDLDVTRIPDLPPGRVATVTVIARWAGPKALVAMLHQETSTRTFVICPLREAETESTRGASLPDAETLHRTLEHDLGTGSTSLLHGAMTESDKLAAITRFSLGEARILVSTTVVEVGIDIPDADLIVIIGAERFGLATLHQLRGRVGRGGRPGRCLLLHLAENAHRLEVLARSSDGFAIAETDLAERGPGSLLGTEQHGLLSFIAADPLADLDLLQGAHDRVGRALKAGTGMPPALTYLLPKTAGPDLLAGG